MSIIFYTLGISLVGLSIFMIFPALLELTEATQDWRVFAVTAFIGLFIGVTMMIACQRDNYKINIRQVYLLTTIVWVVIPMFSGIPFYFTSTHYQLGVTDAVFEAVSGMTTTGSSVYVNLDNAPKGILLWRSLMTWIGGMGIIILTMTVLPYLRVGGMQLFQTESSDRSGKVLAKTHQIALLTTATYITLSALCALCYYLAGMTGFDAINHAMCTLATAGFSTHDLSFGYFNSSLIEWVAVLFMMLGATPMLLYYTAITQNVANRALVYQSKVFWIEIGLIVLVVTLYVMHTSNMGFGEALTLSAFNLVSIATTTGFASTDYSLWGPFAVMVFYFLTVTGGCTGSTSGGIKTFRLIVMAKTVMYKLKKLTLPHGVFSVRMGGSVVNEEIMRSVAFFFLMYVFVFVVITLCLASTGLDLITSMSGTASTLSGVGPGLGRIIGPVGNYEPLTDFAKWSLIVSMLAGRLEILTMMVLLTRNFWREFR